MQNKDVAHVLEAFAPLALAEDYDNVGLLVGEPDSEVSGILTSLDITLAVLEEALAKGLNLIVSHHPIWFRPRSSLVGNDFVSEAVLFAVRNRISLYACHTNLDNISSGVNRAIAQRLGLEAVEFLVPKNESLPLASGQTCPAGSGMIGILPEAQSVQNFLKGVKEKFACGCIRYSPTIKKEIRRVAVCGGSGGFLLEAALRQEVDAFLTSDLSYHRFFDPRGRLLFLDMGHYESEQFTAAILAERLKKYLADIGIHVSQANTNPIRYFT